MNCHFRRTGVSHHATYLVGCVLGLLSYLCIAMPAHANNPRAPVGARSAAESQKNDNDNDAAVASLFEQGLQASEAGQFPTAERLFNDALAVHAEDHKPDPLRGLVLYNLGRAIRSQQRIDEAEGPYREALPLLRARYASDSAEVLNGLLALAGVLIDRDQTAEARKLVDEATKALAHQKRQTSDSLEQTAIIGGYYARLRVFEVGEPLLETTVLVFTDPKSIHVANAHYWLGWIRYERGAYAEVPQHLETAVKIWRAGKPPYATENLANGLNLLGRAYAELKQLAKAEPLLAEAVTLRRSFNAQPRALSAALYDLAHLQRLRNELPEAVKNFVAALAIDRTLYTANDRKLAETLVALGDAQKAAEQWPAAEANFLEAADIYRSHPDESIQTVQLLAVAADLAQRQGDTCVAQGRYRAALTLARARLAHDHKFVAELQRTLKAPEMKDACRAR